MPLRHYAHERIGFHKKAQLCTTMVLFEAAKLIDFTYMKGHRYTDDEVRLLKSFPFVGPSTVDVLITERDDYYWKAKNTDSNYGFMDFWADNKDTLPGWYRVAMDVVLIQPTSAFMERVFSIVRETMANAPEERVENDRVNLSTMLKCNRVSGVSGTAGGTTGRPV